MSTFCVLHSLYSVEGRNTVNDRFENILNESFVCQYLSGETEESHDRRENSRYHILQSNYDLLYIQPRSSIRFR